MFSGQDLSLDFEYLKASPHNLSGKIGLPAAWLCSDYVSWPQRYPGGRIESSLEQEQGYQADEDAAELHDVRVGHRVEAADPGVEDRDQGRAHHRRVQLHVYYHRQGGA